MDITIKYAHLTRDIIRLLCLFFGWIILTARGGTPGVCDVEIPTFKWCAANTEVEPGGNYYMEIGSATQTFTLCWDQEDADGDPCTYDLSTITVLQGGTPLMTAIINNFVLTYPGSFDVTPAATESDLLNIKFRIELVDQSGTTRTHETATDLMLYFKDCSTAVFETPTLTDLITYAGLGVASSIPQAVH